MTKYKTYQKLRIFMFKNGITQKHIADWLGISSNAVCVKMKKEKFTHSDEKIILQKLSQYERDISRDLFLDCSQ